MTDEAPRTIWAWTAPRLEHPRHFWTTGIAPGPATRYHHDDVVRELREALAVTAAVLQAEKNRTGGVPFAGNWSIPLRNWRGTVTDALDMADAALAKLDEAAND